MSCHEFPDFSGILGTIARMNKRETGTWLAQVTGRFVFTWPFSATASLQVSQIILGPAKMPMSGIVAGSVALRSVHFSTWFMCSCTSCQMDPNGPVPEGPRPSRASCGKLLHLSHGESIAADHLLICRGTELHFSAGLLFSQQFFILGRSCKLPSAFGETTTL